MRSFQRRRASGVSTASASSKVSSATAGWVRGAFAEAGAIEGDSSRTRRQLNSRRADEDLDRGIRREEVIQRAEVPRPGEGTHARTPARPLPTAPAAPAPRHRRGGAAAPPPAACRASERVPRRRDPGVAPAATAGSNSWGKTSQVGPRTVRRNVTIPHDCTMARASARNHAARVSSSRSAIEPCRRRRNWGIANAAHSTMTNADRNGATPRARTPPGFCKMCDSTNGSGMRIPRRTQATAKPVTVARRASSPAARGVPPMLEAKCPLPG